MPNTRAVTCCSQWERFDTKRKGLTRWQILHRLCHSRIPFTAERIAETTPGLSIRDARGLVAEARRMGWLVESRRDSPRLYTGLLSKLR